MKIVNVTQFRRNLADHLANFRRGERLRITSRGRFVAALSAPSASSGEVEAVRARLRGSLLRYDGPLEPVIHPAEWDVNR
jgi:antitoxin (DNA-binding transcriptional repressor) of toxin-antitoxin stability system